MNIWSLEIFWYYWFGGENNITLDTNANPKSIYEVNHRTKQVCNIKELKISKRSFNGPGKLPLGEHLRINSRYSQQRQKWKVYVYDLLNRNLKIMF